MKCYLLQAAELARSYANCQCHAESTPVAMERPSDLYPDSIAQYPTQRQAAVLVLLLELASANGE